MTEPRTIRVRIYQDYRGLWSAVAANDEPNVFRLLVTRRTRKDCMAAATVALRDVIAIDPASPTWRVEFVEDLL